MSFRRFLKKKKFYILSSVVLLALVFFLARTSPLSPVAKIWSGNPAAGCHQNQDFFFFKYINPILSLAEKAVKVFGLEVSLAASPDPDNCGSDSVSCDGSRPGATISWNAVPNSGDTLSTYLNNYTLTIPGVAGSFSNANSTATSVTISGFSGRLASNTTYNYYIEAYDWWGNSSAYWGYTGQPYGSFTTPNCVPPPKVVNGSCGSALGQSYNWNAPPSGSLACSSGSFGGIISQSAYWDWYCYGSGGGSNAYCYSYLLPVVGLSASPTTITQGNGINISWATAWAYLCSATGGWSGAKSPSGGLETYYPAAPGAAYALYCYNAVGAESLPGVAYVTVNPPAACNLPWGGTIASGASTEAYFNSSLACGSMCFRQTRTCNNGTLSGTYTKQTCTVPMCPPPITLSASPATIIAGNSSTLTWSSSNATSYATSCTASGSWNGSKATGGSSSVFPTSNSTYTLTCTGPGGSANKSVTVTVNAAAPMVSLSASPNPIIAGNSSTLTWNSTNATTCTASNGWSGAKATSGTSSVSPASTTLYTLTCTGPGGSASSTVMVTVNAAAPTLTISASPATINLGSSTTLTWSTTNATSCTASVAWSGGKAVNGSQSVTPASIGSINYVLQCTGPGGSVIKTATVTVNALPVPTLTISASPNPIIAGNSSTLAWTTANATSCWSSGGNASDGWQNASQAFSNGLHTRNAYPIPPQTTYSIECWNASGVSSGIRSVTVNVNCTTTNLCSHVGASCTASDCGTSINNPARCDQRNNCTGLLTTVPLSSCSGCAGISVPCPACPLKTDVWKEIPPQ